MEILVRLTDQYDGEDLIAISKSGRRGDVVVGRPDGSYWGPCELKNPQFIILRAPLPTGNLMTLLSADITEDPLSNPVLHKRAFHLDLDKLGIALMSAKEARDLRFPGGKDVEDYRSRPDQKIIDIPLGVLLSAIVRKEPLPNPLRPL
jgi:hypothetical protein